MTPRRTRRAVAVAALAVVLAGCGGATPTSAGPPTAPGSVAVPGPSSSSPPSTTPVTTGTTAATGPSDAPGVTTVVGTIRPGALPRCLVLTADDGRHFVLAGAGDPPVGVPVAVRGSVESGTASFCNAGATLRVQRVTTR